VAYKTLIIGCGYIGLPLALGLQALAEHCFRRVITGSVADSALWESMNARYDLVTHCASSGRGGEAAYEEVFLKGVQMINTHQAQARRLLVSSTSVYGQTQGEIVTEESPAEPLSATSRILREAEKLAVVSGITVVRSSSIYGPGRGVLFDKFQRGDAVIEGDGLRWTNQIHQHDLVSAMIHLIEVGKPGEIYNASDDRPVTYLDYYTWCSKFLNKPMPPFGPVNTQRKRGLTNKRVSNVKLRGTGWSPVYPSFREGIAHDYEISKDRVSI
jgi:nucleoside-diphosphate-sugar epimerase